MWCSSFAGKNWLHVPAKQKPKVESFPEKKVEEVYIEEEEISDDPTVLKGAKVNRLGIAIKLINYKNQNFKL